MYGKIQKEVRAGVPKRIKELRIIKGYSQPKMAEELFISLSTYRKIEAGEKLLSMNQLLSLIQIFGINFNEFVRPLIKEIGDKRKRNNKDTQN